MFGSHAKRLAAERIHNLKNAMISGVWANSNYDDENETREKILQEIDGFAEESLAVIYGYKQPSEYQQEMDMAKPFWSAMRVPTIDPNISKEEIGELGDER